MRHARAVVVALVVDEDLRLVLEPAKGGGMDDPVAITLKLAARSARTGALLRKLATPARFSQRCSAGTNCSAPMAVRVGFPI